MTTNRKLTHDGIETLNGQIVVRVRDVPKGGVLIVGSPDGAIWSAPLTPAERRHLAAVLIESAVRSEAEKRTTSGEAA